MQPFFHLAPEPLPPAQQEQEQRQNQAGDGHEKGPLQGDLTLQVEIEDDFDSQRQAGRGEEYHGRLPEFAPHHLGDQAIIHSEQPRDHHDDGQRQMLEPQSPGRETLDDINMIVYCGGFSNSDVLGSAKGWAGGFLWNEKAKAALDRFYNRPDTLSLGICNGCQLMIELGLLTPDHEQKPKMRHNDSHKFESQFIGLTIPENNSVMFGSLSDSKLGIWVAHGEGKFELPYAKERYNIVAQYTYDAYPANPNGSPYGIAGIASADGRHLAMMPHLERAIFPWQCGHYPADRKTDEITPWIEAFVNARKWVEQHTK